MSKSNRLRRNLKAADRRRRRRTSNQASNEIDSSPQVNVSNVTGVDVPGILVESILLEADLRNETLRDSAVISALKAVETSIAPRSVEASAVYVRMTEQLSKAGRFAEGRRVGGVKTLETRQGERRPQGSGSIRSIPFVDRRVDGIQGFD